MHLRLVFITTVLAATGACTEPFEESVLVDEVVATGPQVPPYLADLSVDQLVALHCPGVVYAAGVTTYQGLAGTYQRSALSVVGEPVRLKFVTTRDNPDAAGTFTGTRTGPSGFPVAIGGKFFAIGDNPAIGAALALDTNNNGEIDQTHFVLGLRRSFGRITGLCLAGTQKPFLMSRVLF